MTIPDSVLAAIRSHALETSPEECCGLLLGNGEGISASVRARNVADDRQRRYRIDPADHFAAIRQARATGGEVVGAYHSHPASPPVPSHTDRTEAFESFLFVIVGPSDTRAWRLLAGNFTEVPLVRLP